jgi:hypothetical protein
MKIEANGFWRRGTVSILATTISKTNIFKTDKGDGLNLRPNN